MKAKQRNTGYVKSRKSAASPVKASSVPTPKATPEASVNMGLGKLKGAVQERRSRLDKEIKRQGG